jgi:hypothetical protein
MERAAPYGPNGRMSSRSGTGNSVEQPVTRSRLGFFVSRTQSVPFGSALKMEELLRVAQRQRDLHMEKLRRRQSVPNDMHMGKDDMKEIYNTWRNDVGSWMNPSTLATYEELQHNSRWQDAHQLRKIAFSTYLFQLSGCKVLLHKLIELPLISSSFPGSVRSSVEPPAAILNDLSAAIFQVWRAQNNYSEGRKLSCLVTDKVLKFDELSDWEQQLIEDFDTGRSATAWDRALTHIC